jgi:signal transduction histidine kinase
MGQAGIGRVNIERERWVFVCIVAMLAGVTALHYLTSAHLLPYHTMYRSLYYLPIGVAAVTWGVRGGVATALLTTIVYIPHVIRMGATMPGGLLDNLLEVVVFNAVAFLTGSLSDAQRHQRRRAEALRAYIDDVLAGLPVGVATADLHGGLTPQNPAAVELLQDLADAPHVPTEPGYTELMIGRRPLGVRRSTLHAADGATAGQVLVLEDLSEQRRLHEQVRRVEHLAALGQLAGGVAHEIRNPLAIVRAVSQLLATKLQDRQQVSRHLEVLASETDRIDRLIGELLEYGSSRPLHLHSVEIRPFITELITSLTPYAEQHNITIRIEPASTLPALKADGDSLRRALLNLLLNAIQASEPGQEVTLTCAYDERYVRFSVRDYGRGIPMEIRERIFDPFFTTRDDGVGMGLAVVSRIATEHGGAIETCDTPGGGTIMTLCIPIEGDTV